MLDINGSSQAELIVGTGIKRANFRPSIEISELEQKLEMKGLETESVEKLIAQLYQLEDSSGQFTPLRG